jgi:non-specific serine/threonine protein kinase
MGDEGKAAYPLTHLGRIACREGRYAEARALLQESTRILRRVGDRRLLAECLDDLAEVARFQDHAERAARLFGASQALREPMRRPSKIAVEVYAGHVARLRDTLGEAAFTAAWEAGRALTWQQAADYALEDSTTP